MSGLSYTNGGGSTHQFYPVPSKKQDGPVRKRPGVGDGGEGEGSMQQQPDSGDGETDSSTTDVLLGGGDMQPRAAAYGDYGFPQMYPQKGRPPYMQAGQQIPAPYAQFPPQGPYFQQIGYPGQASFLGPQYPPLGSPQEQNLKQKEVVSEAAVTPKLGKKKVKGKKKGECPRCLVNFSFFGQLCFILIFQTTLLKINFCFFSHFFIFFSLTTF